MIAVKGANRRIARDPAARHVKLVQEHERNEAKLRRAMKAWEKSYLALHRAERRLDKAWALHQDV